MAAETRNQMPAHFKRMLAKLILRVDALEKQIAAMVGNVAEKTKLKTKVKS